MSKLSEKGCKWDSLSGEDLIVNFRLILIPCLQHYHRSPYLVDIQFSNQDPRPALVVGHSMSNEQIFRNSHALRPRILFNFV